MDPNGKELAAYRQRLQSARCPRCKSPLQIRPEELVERTTAMLNKSYLLHPCLHCPKCKGWACIGQDTFRATKNMPTLAHLESTKDFKITWCCDQGRLFLVFSLLCGFLSAQPISGTAARPKTGSTRSKSLDQPKGVGYSSRWSSSFFSPTRNHKGKRASSKSTTGNIDDGQNPEMLQRYLTALSALMPSSSRKAATAFDSSPQPVVTAMIQRSPMLHYASEVLRRAAIQEINTQLRPVTAALDFLETVADHQDTIPALLRERTVFPPSEQLFHTVLGSARKRQFSTNLPEYDTAQSLIAIVQDLAIPCRKFMGKSHLVDMSTADGPSTLLVMQRICRLADHLGALSEQEGFKQPEKPRQATAMLDPDTRRTSNVTTRAMAARAARAAEGSEGSRQQGVLEKARDWHRPNCVKELPDDEILKGHHFRRDATANKALDPKLGRMRKLLAQVSSLSTDLPEGIYVRHGESRVDVLKILIIGPAGTPYENGLFEFDMYCDHIFPDTPPRMFFRTTAGGRIGFNPNLYASGKVCLSLLDTWHGQPWLPSKSTILQVLVSIQSMIFVEHPWCNEPGRENKAGDPKSESYNREIERLTTQYALLPWLTDPRVKPAQEPESRLALPPILGTSSPAQAPPNTGVKGSKMASAQAKLAQAAAAVSRSVGVAKTSQTHASPKASMPKTPVSKTPVPTVSLPKTPAVQKPPVVPQTPVAPKTSAASTSVPNQKTPTPNPGRATGHTLPSLKKIFPPTLAQIGSKLSSHGNITINSKPYHQSGALPAAPLHPPTSLSPIPPFLYQTPPVGIKVEEGKTESSPSHSDSIWEDVVRKHFEIRSAVIMQRVRAWAAVAPAEVPVSHSTWLSPATARLHLREGAAKLEQELRRHGFEV